MSDDLNLLYPLNEFYEQAGLPLPRVQKIEGADVPEPYCGLLFHQRDMTPTLAAAWQANIQLRLVRKELRGDVYSREIVLEVEGGGQPVVFGAIRIYLDHFPTQARRLVLEGKRPLGTILQTEAIVHSSRPEAYIQVVSDVVINEALRLDGERVLYGRRNVIWNASRHPLAQVVEILPPWSGPLPPR